MNAIHKVALAIALAMSLESQIHAGPAKVYRRAVRATVWICNPGDDSSGTGVIVDLQRKRAVTNYHVVGASDDVIVFFPVYLNANHTPETSAKWYVDNLEYLAGRGLVAEGKVIARDPSKDLAVLELSKVPNYVRDVRLATAAPHKDDPLHMVGHPSDRPLFRYGVGRTKGVARASWHYATGQQVSSRTLTFYGNAWHGNSGGPVLNDDGQLVGIVASGSGMKAFAIDVSEVRDILGTIKRLAAFSVENTTKTVLYFQIRFAPDEQWQFKSVHPGRHWTFWHDREIQPQIRFDYSFDDGYQERRYDLNYYTCYYGRGMNPNMKDDAREFYFQRKGDGVDLYKR